MNDNQFHLGGSMIRTKNIFMLCIVMLMVMIMIAGCSKEEKKEMNTAAKGKDSYVIKHAMGETTIKGTPKRVVVLTNEGAEALLSVGVTPVGSTKPRAGDEWYPHLAKELKDTKVVGTERDVNLEAIMKLKPDLIIGNKMRHEKVYEQLKEIAPTVYAETLRGDWKENFTLYTKAVNKEKEGNKALDDYKKRIEGLKEKLGDKVDSKVSIIRFVPGDVRIYQKNSFSGVVLNDIGFKRPPLQDKDDFAIKGVTKEQIPDMDGDYLFYFTSDKDTDKTNEGNTIAKEWTEDPLFKQLQASKNEKVFEVDEVIWNTAGGIKAANLMLDDIEKYFLK
ncbi:YfiY (ABC transport system substrate-binding protein) [Bacillus cereus Rock3-44]|nr:YfiY (ABC transport system substrate-binding protein) [Bacillus cereus Rock3-44]